MLVSELMSDDLVTVSPSMTLKDTDRVLTSNSISGAPVIDRGALVGVISQSDIVRVLYDEQVAATEVSQFLQSPFPIALPALEEIARERAKIADRMVEITVGEAMTASPITVGPDDDVAAAAQVMCDSGVHRVLVSDGGKLVGLLSSLDLARLVAEGS
jgi:CBS domain-containing protein